MTSEQLESFFENEKFDDVLQRVTVPASFTIQGSKSQANSGKTRISSEFSSKGRSNLESVFEWLREEMKVRTILSITVNDLNSPAHSDESIEKAMRGFGVERWDWQKIDISTGVIETVAPAVRVVHLYWSGNNSVLRGWSDEGGLKQLQQLEEVHIHTQPNYLNSYNRTKADMNLFEMQMNRMCKDKVKRIKIVCELEKPRRNKTSGTIATKIIPTRPSQHEWIDCMDKFRSLLLEAEINFSSVNQRAISLEEPIRVALIDYGIDITRLMYKHSGGKSFSTINENVNPYYNSSGGHGPAMASQIYRICPRAQLHVLKLDDYSTKGGERQITPWSAAQAIREAVAKKVHIISMSWTIPPPEDSKTKTFLESAISEARGEKILMFCSASDGGPIEDTSFPYVGAKDRIFRIGAATAEGIVDPRVGNPTSLDFTFPGSNVETEDVDKKVNYQTGSSVATALATGLAALILYCVQISLLRAGKDSDKKRITNAFGKLKEYEGMHRAFRNIGTTPESNNKYIEVWKMFGKYTKENQNGSVDEMIDLIANLGNDLCRNI
ncbi:hypothetical protein NHQ30_005217 [Ciborinia camelliae]|nr:hypothetical protein NHQ30_005217 [Ciborinia camelliae]